MVSAISSPAAPPSATQLANAAPAAAQASKTASAQLAPDTVSISAAGQNASATGQNAGMASPPAVPAGRDGDGDGH